MRLVLLGLPGAGKGTQGVQISQEYQIPHISTGSIIREAISSGSSLGIEANRYISKGNLIPDSVAIEIVRGRLQQADCTRGWILDGFPRTVPQAIHLDETLSKDNASVDTAFDIRISEDEAIRRIVNRRMCRQCGATYHLQHYRAENEGRCDTCGGDLYQRADDNEQTARRRLKVYMAQTHPVLHYYAQDARLYSISGERRIEEVFLDVKHVLINSLQKHRVGDSR